MIQENNTDYKSKIEKTLMDNKDKIDIDKLNSLIDEVFLLSLSLSTMKPVSSLVEYLLNARSK